MFMVAIALFVQETRQRRIRRTCNPPWFLNQHAVIVAARCSKTIHAPVEVREVKAKLSQEPLDRRLVPIRATTGPFYEHPGSDA